MNLISPISGLHNVPRAVIHVPPEVVGHRPLYVFSADVWPFGTVIYEVRTRRWPFFWGQICLTADEAVRQGEVPTLPVGDPFTELCPAGTDPYAESRPKICGRD
jgi:hypothetical protein